MGLMKWLKQLTHTADSPETKDLSLASENHPPVLTLPDSLPMTEEEMTLVALFASLLGGKDENGKQLHIYEIKRVA